MISKLREVEGVVGSTGTYAFENNDRAGQYSYLMNQGNF